MIASRQPYDLVIYHGSCFDGFTAAWLYDRWCGRFGSPATTYHAARYGELAPDVFGRRVLIVDFSYPRAELEVLAGKAAELRLLDHHITAQDQLLGLPWATFDQNRSGCGLLWDELLAPMSGPERPWLADYVEDRDLWRWQLPGSRATNAWISSHPFTFEAWDEVSKAGQPRAELLGGAVLQYIAEYGEHAIRHARDEFVGGFVVPVVNLSYQNSSEHLERLLRARPEAPFVASFFRRFDRMWQFSLRSRAPADTRGESSTVDVSKVAKLWGGGGHVNAAGFESSVLPWLERPARWIGDAR